MTAAIWPMSKCGKLRCTRYAVDRPYCNTLHGHVVRLWRQRLPACLLSDAVMMVAEPDCCPTVHDTLHNAAQDQNMHV